MPSKNKCASKKAAIADEYTFEEHRHRFAVWAAARAVQRSFTSVEILKSALEHSGVREYMESYMKEEISAEEYRKLHTRWCSEIMCQLKTALADNKKVTFGRVSKFIAMYIKSMVVIVDGSLPLSKVAYPPIDGIILNNLSKQNKYFKQLKWSQLDLEDYFEMIECIQKILGDKPMWMIEEYWTVVRD